MTCSRMTRPAVPALVLAAAILLLALGGGHGQKAAGSPTASGKTGELLTCGDRPFPPSVFNRPENAEKADTPAAAALRRVNHSWVGFPGRRSGWRLIFKSNGRAGFLNGTPNNEELPYVVVQRKHGKWDFAGSSGCIPEPYRRGLVAAYWSLASPRTVDPATQVLTVDVTEQSCADGDRPGKRLLPGEVEYREEAVVITYFVRPKPGMSTCPGNPPVRRRVQLDEPLGSRTLQDGSEFPPAAR